MTCPTILHNKLHHWLRPCAPHGTFPFQGYDSNDRVCVASLTAE